jgi:glycosyltransferase involved in cell wall biosynthesis
VQAIESALKQDYSNLEVVVVDDGSTDNTAEVVAALCRTDDRLRYVHQKNAGLSAARNTGIREAKFSFVGFLDADDQWLPNLLSRAIDEFAKLPEEFAMVACRSRHVDVQGAPMMVKQLTPSTPQEITCRDILLKTRFSPSSVVAKRAAFEECGYFDTTLRSAEDRDMWVRIASRFRVLQNPDRLVVVRRHSSSMSTHADRMKVNTRKVFKKAYRNNLVPKLALGFWLKVISFQYFQTAWMYQASGRRARALGDLILSILLWPCFFETQRLNEPPLFRLRASARFVMEICRGNSVARPTKKLNGGEGKPAACS